MKNLWYQQSLISIKDISVQQIQQVMDVARQFKAQASAVPALLAKKLIAHCFFEQSTRTRFSFEAATARLGGNAIGFANDESLSVQKGETLSDTMRVIGSYADLIVIRHPREGAARLAAQYAGKPVINAGDGANQHPTQTLVDLFTLTECQSSLQGLAVALIGDLKFGRTIHSFIHAAMVYGMRLFLVSPEGLGLPEEDCQALKKAGVRFSLHQSLEEVISKADVLYMTRIQRERFQGASYPHLERDFVLTPDLLKQSQPHLKVLHPLPRVKEIDAGVDAMPQAYYFEQAANGVYVRQALLSLILNEAIL